MKKPWQTTGLWWLYILGTLSNIVVLLRLFLYLSDGFTMKGFLPPLLVMACHIALVICFYRGRRLGWILAIVLWGLDLYSLATGAFYLTTGAVTIIYWVVISLIRVLVYGYLTFCRPTRAYFNLGKARMAWEGKLRQRRPGERFARFSARLHDAEYVPAEDPLPESPEVDPVCHTEADLWLDAAERLDALVIASEADGDQSGLTEQLVAAYPDWAKGSGDIRALLDRALSEAFHDLNGYARFPRKGAGSAETTVQENNFILAVTVEQAADRGPYHAAAELRVNWEPSP